MILSTAKIVLKANINLQLENIPAQPIVFAGAPGIGKTRSISAIAKELNVGLVHYSIPEITSEILSGLPDFVNSPDMAKYSVTGSTLSQATDWTVPMLILEANRLANKSPNGCILFLDDIHRINMAVAPYLYGLLEERKLGSYKLDPRVAIVCAMNDSESAGFAGMDSPIKDRCSMIKVEFDFEDWYENFGKYLNYMVSSFVKVNPHYVEEEESTDIEQFFTPRSCSYFGSELNAYPYSFIVKNALELAKMKMSNSAATAFAKHIAYLDKIDFSGLVKARKKINLSGMEPITTILHAYIVNYIVTESDAKYLLTVIEDNITEASFLGFLVGEIYAKFQVRNAGKDVTAGVGMILDAILEPETSKLVIPERDTLLSYGGEFFS